MMGAAVIVFREVLEAALVVAIVMGATRGVARRGRWVIGGVAIGIAGSVAVAASAGAIAAAVQGRGQEIFNAVVLLAAVVMLGWHNVWASRHGRALAAHVGEVGRALVEGAKPLSVLVVVTALAVLREGSETVLFLYGIAASASAGAGAALLAGGAIGLLAGVAAGWLLYRGLLRIPLRHFFTVTGWLVLLVAAGLAASAAGYLGQAGLLPATGGVVWDTSGYLRQDSALGTLLHVLVGYVDRPDAAQIVFYVATVVIVLGLSWRLGRSAGAGSEAVAPR